MHELGIAQNIAEIAERELKSRAVIKKVEKISLRVGKLKAILPDSLTFHFDVVKAEHPLLRSAVLEIEEVPIEVYCPQCQKRFTVEQLEFSCESCGAPVQVQSGEELLIGSITVED